MKARRVVRLVVPSPDRRRVLARPVGLSGWALPTIAVEAHRAWTAESDAAALAGLGGTVAPVHRLAEDLWEVEILDRVPTVGASWIAPEEAARLGADAGAIAAWTSARPEDRAPHLRPGWRSAITGWIDERLERTGPVSCLQHWELGAVLLVPTTAGPIVVKEAAPGFQRESSVLSALDGLPGAPTPVSTDGPRFATRWAGRPANSKDRVRVAAALGALQRQSTARITLLGRAGTPATSTVTRTDQHRAAFAALDHLGLPDAIVHTDAHPGNAVIDEGGVVTVLDWSDAVLGCPAIDLDLLIGHGDTDDEHADEVVAAWCRGFATEVTPVLAALPAIRRAAAVVALALYREHRPRLPPPFLPWWDELTEHWERRLTALGE